MFETILVAVDGSKHATKIAEVAADLAQRYRAKLLMLYVVAPSVQEGIRAEMGKAAQTGHIERSEYEIIQQLGRNTIQSAELCARQKGVEEIEVLAEVGDPAGVIVDIARARRADLIVLGRRGASTLSELLLGSVSHKVTQVSKKPCLIVS
jgi:nucleotide-binding universal stress UspA family protein